MRLFIAVNLNKEMKDALLDMQDAMKWKGVRGNYTKPANLHLTLAFIGEFGDPEAVMDALDDVDFEPFGICLDGVGAFRGLWWTGVSPCEMEKAENDPLRSLTKKVRRALAENGIPFDRKKFSPHITLVRRPDPGDIAPPAPRGKEMMVEKFSLMRSDRGKHGMIYTELYSREAEL